MFFLHCTSHLHHKVSLFWLECPGRCEHLLGPLGVGGTFQTAQKQLFRSSTHLQDASAKDALWEEDEAVEGVQTYM
ncbi:hypothetical protein MHYP_G00311880 [Metynnis hypsauchen]